MEIRVEEVKEKRLDKFLTNYIDESRSYITKLIKNGNVLVNDEEVSPHYEVRLDDIITVDEDYKEEFEYLTASGIALEVKAVPAPVFPLTQGMEKNLLKLYLNDPGILTVVLF